MVKSSPVVASPTATIGCQQIQSCTLQMHQNSMIASECRQGGTHERSLAKMSPEEMKSQEQRDEDARLRKENMNNAMTLQEAQSVSSSIECPSVMIRQPRIGRRRRGVVMSR